jgi:hypothetical protein
MTDDHSFVLKMVVRNALKLIPGLRKQLRDMDEDIVVVKFLRELERSGYEIVKKPRNAGFTLETPGGDGT